MLGIILDKQPQKFFDRCDDELFNKITNKLESLKENPFPQETKRLQDYALPTFRIRIGKYRVLYRVDNKEIVIVVIKIDKRDKVYD